MQCGFITGFMEALPAIAPLVLVPRGSIMAVLASETAPGLLPHPQAPAQTKFERADGRGDSKTDRYRIPIASWQRKQRCYDQQLLDSGAETA